MVTDLSNCIEIAESTFLLAGQNKQKARAYEFDIAGPTKSKGNDIEGLQKLKTLKSHASPRQC